MEDLETQALGWASKNEAQKNTPELACQGAVSRTVRKPWSRAGSKTIHHLSNPSRPRETGSCSRGTPGLQDLHHPADGFLRHLPLSVSSWFRLQFPPPRTSDWGTKSHVELELAASGPLGSAAQQGSPGGGQSSTSHTHPPEKALLPCSKRLCRLGVEGEFVFTPSRLFLDDPELKSDPSSKLAKPPQDQYAPKNKFRRR